MFTFIRRPFCAILLISVFSNPILASDLLPKKLAEDTLSLSPVTVTATRSQMDSNLVSTTTITREDIERLQINSVEQALRGVAGINITNSGGLGKQTSVYMRGTGSGHVLVLVDGVRIGSATSGTAPWQYLPISDIESIEIIRGPRASLYGADAIGGVIYIHTRNAQDSNVAIKPELSIGGGTYGRFKVQGNVSGKLDETWYNLSISRDQTEGFNSCAGALSYGCFTNEPDRDGYKNNSGAVRLGHDFNDWLSLQGHLLYSLGKTQFDGNFVNQTNYTELEYGAQATIQALDFWRIDLLGGESRDESNNFLNGSKKSVFNTKRLSFSALNHFSLSEDNLFTLGYDFQRDRIDSTNNYAETLRYNHAVFVEYQGQWHHNQVNLAFRNDFNQQFGSNKTWSAGWGYGFDNGVSVSASYGTAFKAPTFNELYYPGFGNSHLNPEKSETYEVGIKGKHSYLNWALNGYLTYIKDMIVYDSSIFLPNNLSKARIMGLEAILSGQVYDIDWRVNYSALDPQSMDAATFGKLLARRAQQVFRFDVDYSFSELSIGSSINVEGRRFDDIQNTRRVAGFTTWDLRAEYSFFEQLTAQASVKNLLNRKYQTVAGYNSAGLTFFFNLRYTPQI